MHGDWPTVQGGEINVRDVSVRYTASTVVSSVFTQALPRCAQLAVATLVSVY